jgi:FG-GAP-like repeat/WW domain/CUB domain/Tyrosine-protein kinase ephrin type A/B receptor-like
VIFYTVFVTVVLTCTCFSCAVYAASCDGIVSLPATSTVMYLTDGSVPNEMYANGLDCFWRICANNASYPDNVVTLTFTRFSTTLSEDFVLIYDGNTEDDTNLWQHSGSLVSLPANARVATSSKNCLLVHFHTNSREGKTGWELSYSEKWVCASGFYCPDPIDPTNKLLCPAGSYCRSGSSAPTTCPAGSYCRVRSSIPTPCPAGVYCPLPGRSNTTHAIVCPPGSYCPPGSSAPTPCAAGKYCPQSGQSDMSLAVVCPAGFYCPSTGQSNASNAIRCPADLTCLPGSAQPAGVICSDSESMGAGHCWRQGTFKPTFRVPSSGSITNTARGASAVYAADLDADGDLDILSASSDSIIAWYENTGGGVFGPKQVITDTAYGATSVYAADIDGDGDLDALSASSSDDSIAWYENIDGQGSFGMKQVITDSADDAQSVYAVDLDGDGDVDVLSASEADDMIAWYENTDGRGNFGPKQIISTNAQTANSVYAVDIDGDGDFDVLSSSFDGDIAWYENTDGRGRFGRKRVVSDAPDGPKSVYAADLDGDGDIDVLSVSSGDSIVAWYENLDGSGQFGDQKLVTEDIDEPVSVYAADLDGDGDLDVLSASIADDTIAWYENEDGKGSFGSKQIITATANGAISVYAADLDGDGDIDVISASSVDDRLAWYENVGADTFGSKKAVTLTANSARSVYAADLNGDGDLDILSASSQDSKIAWYDNMGGGNFGSPRVVTNIAEGAISVYAVDLDGDDDIDVLSASATDDIIAWYQNDGNGNFGPRHIIANTTNNPRCVYAADLNGDGDVDVLSASLNDNTIAWYANTGGGNFSSKKVISDGVLGAIAVFAADLDGDGDLDVMSASLYADTVAWYENTGGGIFGPAQVITKEKDVADAIYSIYAADLNGDGHLDVLSGSANDNTIAWYENAGGGNFSVKHVISDGADNLRAVYAADLDGDGDIDVLSATTGDDTIAWYENTGVGSFGPKQVIDNDAKGASSVYAADIDGDGDLDVLSASLGDDTIAWYTNSLLHPAHAVVSPSASSHSDCGIQGGLPCNTIDRAMQQLAQYSASSLIVHVSAGVYDHIKPSFIFLPSRPTRIDVAKHGATFRFSGLGHSTGFSATSCLVIAVPAEVAGVHAIQGGTLVVDASSSGGRRAIAFSLSTASDSVLSEPTLDITSDLRVQHSHTSTGDGGGLALSGVNFVRMSTVSIFNSSTVDPFGGGCMSLAAGSKLEVGSLSLLHCTSGKHGGGVLVSDAFSSLQVDVLQSNHSVSTGCGGLVAVRETGLSIPRVTLGRVSWSNASSSLDYSGAFCASASVMSVDECIILDSVLDHFLYASDLASLTVDYSCTIQADGLNSSQPADCRLGTVKLSDDQLLCSRCSPGQFVSAVNTECLNCGIGEYAPAFGATTCNACPSGSATLAAASVSCFVCPAGEFLNQTIFACEQCPAGYFTNVTSSTECIPCRVGSISSSTGSVSCSACPAGRYATSPSAASTCQKCKLGRFSDSDGQTNCSVCSAGSSTSVEGSVQCAECPAGRFQNQTTLACEQCPTGYFTNVTSSTECIPCRVGSISSSTGSVSCSACPAGRYATSPSAATRCANCGHGTFTASDGQLKCKQCKPGSSTSIVGSVQCNECPAGRFQNQTTLACERCTPGYFSNTTSAISCTACPIGSASSSVGSVGCTSCPAGRFSAMSASHECVSCRPGYSAPSDSSSSCTPCPRGTFTSLNQSVGCVSCPAGRYANTNGSSECTPCEQHQFSPAPGATSCISCASVDEYSFANTTGSQFCQQCEKQQYLVFVNRSRLATFEGCVACPSNADCSSGRPVADPSWWLDLDAESGRASVYECSTPSACLGSAECGANRLASSENLLCARCSPGYQESGSECVPCERTSIAALFLLFIAVLFLVQIFFFLSQGGSAYVGVVSYFVQTAVLFIGSQTNAGFATLLSVFDLDVVAASSGSSCVVRMSDEVRAVSGFFGPLLAFVCWLIIYCIWTLCQHFRWLCFRQRGRSMNSSALHHMNGTDTHADMNTQETRFDSVNPSACFMCCCSTESMQRFLGVVALWYRKPASPKVLFDKTVQWQTRPGYVTRNIDIPDKNLVDLPTHWYRTLLALFLLTFNGVTRTVFSIFKCIDVSASGDRFSVVEAYPTIGCSGSSYAQISVFASAMMIIYLSVPLFLILRFPRTLLPIRHCFGSNHTHCMYSANPSESSRYVLGALTAPYRRHAAWWKISILLRRLLLVIVVTFPDGRGWRMLAASVVSMTVLVIHLMSQPFLYNIDNIMETLSLSALTLLATLLVQMQPPYSSDDRSWIGVVWGIPFCVVLVWAIAGSLLRVGQIKTASDHAVAAKFRADSTMHAVSASLATVNEHASSTESSRDLMHLSAHPSSSSSHLSLSHNLTAHGDRKTELELSSLSDVRTTIAESDLQQRPHSGTVVGDTVRFDSGSDSDSHSYSDAGSSSDAKATAQQDPVTVSDEAGNASECAAADCESAAVAAALPPGWAEINDVSSGQSYFYKKETNESTWHRPQH